MALSICVLTADPPDRVAAALEPVRALADEVVIAVDARVSAETFAGYGALADAVHSVDFLTIERDGSWVHAHCRGDWILRLDSDEVPSAALAARLPDLMDSRVAERYAIARAWCFPDAGRLLDELPWSTDFQARLVRSGAPAQAPAVYVAEPIYDITLLTRSEQERRARAVRSEVARPHEVAAGGGRLAEAFLLPELRPALRTRAQPPSDAAVVSRAVAPGRATAPRAEPPRAELNGFARAVSATIEPYGGTPRMLAGEQTSVFVHVKNEGAERWPASLDARPPIRLSYRWLRADGSMHVADGLRSPLPVPVGPGERVLAPVRVFAPAVAGEYVLEVDLVHEHVRWFDRGCRIDVSVGSTAGLPPVGERLRVSPAPRAQRLRRQRIPRVFHRVWLGPDGMPEQQRAFAETFRAHHSGWELREWTDRDLPALDIGPDEVGRARSWAELSNLVRYEVLHRHGGVYVDTDVECRRSFAGLLRGIDAFAALELPGRVGNAVLGSVPGHRAFARAARESRPTLGLGAHEADANGPYFLSLILEQEPGVTILGADRFYPYLWDEPERRGEPFPGAYAVHHWAESWRRGPEPG